MATEHDRQTALARLRLRLEAASVRMDAFGAIGIEDLDAEELSLIRSAFGEYAQACSDAAWGRADARLEAVCAALLRTDSKFPKGDALVDSVRDLVAGFDTMRDELNRRTRDVAELTRRIDALRNELENMGRGALL